MFERAPLRWLAVVLVARYAPAVRFHAVQTDPVWLEVEANRLHIASAIERLAPSPRDFVVLPEMCETGWTTDLGVHRATRDSAPFFSQLASRHRIWLQAGVGMVEADGSVSNAAVVFDPAGALRATYRKFFLFPSERDAFAAGRELALVDVDGIRVCPLICYDLRFPELWRLAALSGAEVFSVSSSWPAVRHEHWRALLVARAIENQAVVVAANRSGTDPSNRYDGGSVAVNWLGERVVECGAAPGSASIEFDRAGLDGWRARFSALRDARPDLLGAAPIAPG